MKRFNFLIEINVTLDQDEVWPDGDAPPDPSAADARKKFLDSDPYGEEDILQIARDWNLSDDAEVVVSEEP